MQLKLGGVKLANTAAAKIYIDLNLFCIVLAHARRPVDANSCRMEDQVNRPHRKTKEKKKKAHGGIVQVIIFERRH